MPFLKVTDPLLNIPVGGVFLIAIASPTEMGDVNFKDAATKIAVAKSAVGV
jgi:hypothetical protein